MAEYDYDFALRSDYRTALLHAAQDDDITLDVSKSFINPIKLSYN